MILLYSLVWLTKKNSKVALTFDFKVLKAAIWARQIVYRLHCSSLAAKKKYCHLKQNSLEIHNFCTWLQNSIYFILFVLTITKQMNYKVKASYNTNKKKKIYIYIYIDFVQKEVKQIVVENFYWKGTPRGPYSFYLQFSFRLNYSFIYH